MKPFFRIQQAPAWFATLGVLAGIAFFSIEDAVATMVALALLGTGCVLLQFLSDARERRLALRLFVGAFLLRMCFGLLCYKTGLIAVLGGADDVIWRVSWAYSRTWMGLSTMQNATWVPDTFWEIYNATNIKRNTAYLFFSSYFYYVINTRSQMALAMVNCFLNAMTAVMIYLSARFFFPQRASYFAGIMAVVLPNFLIWSVLTIKEPALIFFEITVFYFFILSMRKHNLFYALIAAACIFIAVGLRFYVGYLLAVACLSMIFVLRSSAPRRAAFVSTVATFIILLLANALGLVRLNPVDIYFSQVEDFTRFRDNVATGMGSTTGVRLDYDISTPVGAAMMVATGAAYLLLSPFPWQLGVGRQAVTLPDLLLWWYLVAFFIVPGIGYCWRNYPTLALSVGAFVLPLLLFYSLIFGNVGLAYRQRAQMMPFFLLLAAAGYEKRRLKRFPNAKAAFKSQTADSAMVAKSYFRELPRVVSSSWRPPAQ